MTPGLSFEGRQELRANIDAARRAALTRRRCLSCETPIRGTGQKRYCSKACRDRHWYMHRDDA